MNDQQRIRISLSLSTLLGLIVFTLVFLVAKRLFDQDTNNLLLLIAGMLSAAALSMLSRVFDRQSFAGGPAIYFDVGRTRQAINNVIDAEFREVRHIENNTNQTWEPTADSLLGQDPTLALAKLRIDLERELRRIASSREIAIDARKISVMYLLDGLARGNVLGNSIVTAIKNILPVCNAAIHGGDVKLDVAINVLDIGKDILNVLRTYPRETKKIDNDEAR